MYDLEKYITLIKQKNYGQAIYDLEDFAKNNTVTSEVLNLLALAYQYNSNFSKSLEIYKQSLKIKNDFKIYDRMGEVCIKNNNLKSAQKYFNQSLLINNNNSITHNNLGLVLAHLDHESKSIKHFKQAIKLDDEYREPIYNLLEIYEKTNDIKNLKKLILFYLSKFKSDQIIQFYYAYILEKENLLSKANKVLKNINFKQNNQAWDIKKLYQLGKINDSLQNYSEAFLFFTEANEKSLNLIGKNLLINNSYIKKLDQYLEQLNNRFIPKKIINIKYNNNFKHFFLVGFPRSGTTLLDTILRSHKDILVVEEKPMVQKMREKINSFDSLNKFTNKEAKILADAYFSELSNFINTKEIDKKILIDKFPLNIIESRLIHYVFPNAKLIFAIRHPIDCVLSSFMQNFQINQAMINFLDIEASAQMYDKVMQLWLNYKEIPQNKIYKIKYENLINNFEKTIKNLIKFMGIKWDKKILNFNETALSRQRVRTPSYKQVIQPIYKSSSYRWLKYKDEVKVIKPVLNKWIKYFDYE